MFDFLSLFNNKSKKFGYLFDDYDYRDYSYSEAFGTLPIPREASVAVNGIEPRDQGQTNSCVGYSCSTALRLALHQDGVGVPALSAFFTYFNARKLSDAPVTDSGTYIRDAIKATQKFGICASKYWKHNEWKVNSQPDWNAYRMAHDFRGIRRYYRVNSADEVRQAIAAGRPVIGGWSVNYEFCQSEGPSSIDVIEDNYIGNHAMLIEGYDEDSNFTIHNSWGQSWRNGGRVKVTEAFIERMVDGWAIDT